MIIKNNKIIDSCSDTLPIGTLQPFLGKNAPQGYLFCEGQLLDKANYPELYQICGDLFGESTPTQFYLPDLRGRVVAGYNEDDSSFNTIGQLLGEKTHTLTVNEMPKHTHNVTVWNNYPASSYAGSGKKISETGDNADGNAENSEGVIAKGGSEPHNNIQPTLVLKWIVKAYSLLPTDFFSNGYDALPVGSEIEYDGTDVPAGYVKIDDDYSGNEYSSEEMRVGTWFGKPLYSKTFYRSKLINGTEEVVNHGIANVDKIWPDISKSFVIWPEGITGNLPYLNTDLANSIFVREIGIATFKLVSGLDRSNLSGYITFNYTKTTD